MATIFFIIALVLHNASEAENVQFLATAIALFALVTFLWEIVYAFKHNDGYLVVLGNTLALGVTVYLWFFFN